MSTASVLNEQRRHSREAIKLPVQFSPGERGSRPVSGWTVDISDGGALFESTEAGETFARYAGGLSLWLAPHAALPARPQQLGGARVVRSTRQRDRLQIAVAFERDTPAGLYAPSLVGLSPQMHQVKSVLRHMVTCDYNVLVTGETGTGKTLLGRCVHRYSRGPHKPFIRVNCASIPESLFESALFGHEKGAFTDARQAKPGFFRLAAGGTILLDDISEVPVSLQAKLLRVLEEKEFYPVGGQESVKVKCRIVATSNAALDKGMAAGRFRTDLYYRLAELTMDMPPLRERREDIPLLAEYFRRKHMEHLSKPYEPLTPEQLSKLTEHAWPGNARELDNYTKQSCLMGGFRAPSADAGTPNSCGAGRVAVRAPLSDKLHVHACNLATLKQDIVTAAEREAVVEALQACRSNRTKAAQTLGVSYRTLLRKIARYEIEF